MRDRYRQNWAVGRHSARTWTLGAAMFLIYIAVGLCLDATDTNAFVRVLVALLAPTSLAPGG